MNELKGRVSEQRAEIIKLLDERKKRGGFKAQENIPPARSVTFNFMLIFFFHVNSVQK